MSDNPEESRKERGFRKLSSEDILKERGHDSNGHSLHGLPDDDDTGPSCVTCRDTRWLAAAPAEPGRSPILVPCVCQDTARNQVNRLSTYANLGNLSTRTFKSLNRRGRRGKVDPDSFGAAVSMAEAFADDPSGWLAISGPVGSGKSHIAAAITNNITSNGKPAKYVSAMQIPDIVRRLEIFDLAEDAEEAWDVIVDAHVLILDDFGASDWAAKVSERIDHLLTHRAVLPLPTVIMLSRPCEQLPDRFRLRLMDIGLCTISEIRSVNDTESAEDSVPKTMLERMTFDNFDPNGAPTANRDEQASLSLALDAAKRFAADPEGWLYLHGVVGVGKTHLAVAVAAHAASIGIRPTFWRLPDLLDKLRHSFSNRSDDSFYEIFESVKNSELLILDDFGPPTMTDWTLEKLYQLVCHRHDRLLPTVTTSPYVIWNPERMEGYYERQQADYRNLQDKLLWESIKSRLQDSSVVTERLMSAPDYRNRGAR